MLIKCQRCGQGDVQAMRVCSTQLLLWVCDECEATWVSQIEVNVCNFEDFGILMAGMGHKGLWSELEPQ